MSIELLPNNVWVIQTDDHHRVWCADKGLNHDPWMTDIIKANTRSGSVAIDAGSNIGTLTYGMLEAGATVWAFEPNYDAFQCLIRNCADYASKLVAQPIALGAKNG